MRDAQGRTLERHPIFYPERLVDSYLRQCERGARFEGWMTEEYFWLLVDRGFRWRMHPVTYTYKVVPVTTPEAAR